MTRHFWVLVHRYAGLFIALFLMLIGLTGSIIVFNPELQDWFDPPPVVVVRKAPLLDSFTLRDRAQALVPNGRINGLTLNIVADKPFTAWLEPRLDPATNKPYELDVSVLMLDPYTGAELKREKYSEDIFPITRKNIMQLVNRLHYQMALPGSGGTWLFGIVALVWTLDCFISAYLTFPVSVRRRKGTDASVPTPTRPSWWSRWKPAWLVKWSGSAYRVNFDLHRAGGLWIWIMLLAIAWSSVGFNLGDQIYQPVMKAVFNMPDPMGDLPTLKDAPAEPAMDWSEALVTARRLMAEQSRLQGFKVLREEALTYQADKGVFFYVVRSDRDLMDEGAGTYMLFDGKTGKFASISLPTGQNAGSTLHSWIFSLHMAQIWGLPFKIFVSCVGILIAMLSVTGVYIWLKKRRARSTSSQRRPLAADGETA